MDISLFVRSLGLFYDCQRALRAIVAIVVPIFLHGLIENMLETVKFIGLMHLDFSAALKQWALFSLTELLSLVMAWRFFSSAVLLNPFFPLLL
jgi:hypothetical protein